MCSILKINTKGTCLLCLSTKNCRLLEDKEDNESSSATAIKVLLRYLEVTNVAQVSSYLPSFNEGEGMNLSVLLCEDCSSATDTFLYLFHQMEAIRFQMDSCLNQLHNFMENGRNDAARLWEYLNRPPGENNTDLSSSSRVADIMRKEIAEKVCQKLTQHKNVVLNPLKSNPTSSSLGNSIVAVYKQPQSAVKHKDPSHGEANCRDDKQPGVPLTIIDRGNTAQLPLTTSSDIAQQVTSGSRLYTHLVCKREHISQDNVRKQRLQTSLTQFFEKAKNVPMEQGGALAPTHQHDKLENNRNSGRTPKPRKVKLCKCYYCGKCFPLSSLCILEYRMHKMMKRRIPQTFSQENMKSALIRIVSKSTATGQNKGHSLPCPFCSRRAWCLKVHLLSYHRDEVIREAKAPPPRAIIASTSAQAQQLIQSSDELSNIQDVSSPPSSSQLHAYTSSKNKCSTCGKLFSTKIGLKLHFAKEHLKPQHKPYACEHCQQRFTQRKHLSVHKIRFHPVAYFSSLAHPLTGFSDRNFIAALSEIIRKGSKIKATLENSSEEFTFKNNFLECPHCEKRFKRMNMFRLHVSQSHLNHVLNVMHHMYYLRNG